MEEKAKVPFWKKTLVVVLACIFIPPVGIALLWLGNKGGKYTRIALTILLGIYSLAWFNGFISGGNALDTTNPNITNKAEVVVEQTTADKAAADKAAADKAAADKVVADKAIADKAAADKAAADKAAADKAAADKAAADKAAADAIITVDNNEDMAALFKVSDFDPFISEFAKKYAGRTIQFDGYVADMTPHENYNTRFDFLIYTGNSGELSGNALSFKFEDINITSDLKLTGSNIPENISKGQNLRLTAKVGEYKEASGLFFLKPISTEIR